MKATFYKIIATLEIWFFQLLNKIEGMFKSIAGIENITESNGDSSKDLFEYLFTNSTVRSIFWAVVGVAVLIAIVLAVFAILKNIFAQKKQQSQRSSVKILGQYGIAVGGMAVVGVLMVVFILMFNAILGVLNSAILNSTNQRGDFGTKAYCATVGEAFYSENVYEEDKVKNDFGKYYFIALHDIMTGDDNRTPVYSKGEIILGEELKGRSFYIDSFAGTAGLPNPTSIDTEEISKTVITDVDYLPNENEEEINNHFFMIFTPKNFQNYSSINYADAEILYGKNYNHVIKIGGKTINFDIETFWEEEYADSLKQSEYFNTDALMEENAYTVGIFKGDGTKEYITIGGVNTGIEKVRNIDTQYIVLASAYNNNEFKFRIITRQIGNNPNVLNISEPAYTWEVGVDSSWVEQTSSPEGINIYSIDYTTIEETTIELPKDVAYQADNLNLETRGIVNVYKYPYLLGLFSSVTLSILLFMTSIGLLARLFDLLILYVSSPLAVATYPLDDGVIMKRWKDTVVSKTFLAWGSVIAMNLFMFIMPYFASIKLSNSDFLMNALFQTLLLVCGAEAVNSASLLFARVLGTDASETREARIGLKSIASGVKATAGLVVGAGAMALRAGKNVVGGAGKALSLAGIGASAGALASAGAGAVSGAFRGGTSLMSMAGLSGNSGSGGASDYAHYSGIGSAWKNAHDAKRVATARYNADYASGNLKGSKRDYYQQASRERKALIGLGKANRAESKAINRYTKENALETKIGNYGADTKSGLNQRLKENVKNANQQKVDATNTYNNIFGNNDNK